MTCLYMSVHILMLQNPVVAGLNYFYVSMMLKWVFLQPSPAGGYQAC